MNYRKWYANRLIYDAYEFIIIRCRYYTTTTTKQPQTDTPQPGKHRCGRLEILAQPADHVSSQLIISFTISLQHRNKPVQPYYVSKVPNRNQIHLASFETLSSQLRIPHLKKISGIDHLINLLAIPALFVPSGTLVQDAGARKRGLSATGNPVKCGTINASFSPTIIMYIVLCFVQVHTKIFGISPSIQTCPNREQLNFVIRQ